MIDHLTHFIYFQIKDKIAKISGITKILEFLATCKRSQFQIFESDEFFIEDSKFFSKSRESSLLQICWTSKVTFSIKEHRW